MLNMFQITQLRPKNREVGHAAQMRKHYSFEFLGIQHDFPFRYSLSFYFFFHEANESSVGKLKYKAKRK